MLPLFLTMFIANDIDRMKIGLANTHRQTELGMVAAAYGLGSGSFFIGYARFEVPSNVLMGWGLLRSSRPLSRFSRRTG